MKPEQITFADFATYVAKYKIGFKTTQDLEPNKFACIKQNYEMLCERFYG